MYAFTTKHQDLVANGATVDYNPEWANGTGYFDGAVTAPLGLVEGEIKAFTDDKKRRGFIVGTRRGNVVVFERYAPSADRDSIAVVCNMSMTLTRFFGPGLSNRLEEGEVLMLIGGAANPNIGERLKSLAQIFAEDVKLHIVPASNNEA